jgi:hypothetical protein
MRRSSDRVADDKLAAGDAGQRHERPDLDVVGGDVMRAAAQGGLTVDGHHVGADAVDRGAHLLQHPRQILDVGLRRGIADHGRTAGQGGRHQRVLGRHHRRLIHQEVAGMQAERRGGQRDQVVPA